MLDSNVLWSRNHVTLVMWGSNKLFEETYGINLKVECDKYNEHKEKRLKVNVIQYCLMTGHINQLYECCKMLYN